MEDEFWKKIRRRDYAGALYERGYFLSSAPPPLGEPEPTTPRTPHAKAVLQRHRVCLLIQKGMSTYPDRVDAAYWSPVAEMLQQLDPSLRAIILHINELIDMTRRVALENGGSHGVWNLMEAASFQTWANELTEALQQYRMDCEALAGG